jgi:DNA-binding Xre family transcriptional regulator
LAKKINITYQNLCALADNKTTSAKFETIEKICLALNCTPNEILLLSPLNKNVTEKDKNEKTAASGKT